MYVQHKLCLSACITTPFGLRHHCNHIILYHTAPPISTCSEAPTLHESHQEYERLILDHDTEAAQGGSEDKLATMRSVLQDTESNIQQLTAQFMLTQQELNAAKADLLKQTAG